MTDNRREQLIDIIKREFIGPDPIDIPGMIQKNGEEILFSDPPRVRYAAGILFPQKVISNFLEQGEVEMQVESEELPEGEIVVKAPETGRDSGKIEFLEDFEEPLNLSNSYKQSAISLTAAVKNGDNIDISVKAGTYTPITSIDPKTEKTVTRYPRTKIQWDRPAGVLPLKDKKISSLNIISDAKETNLRFDITYRYEQSDYVIYTFTLLNKKLSAEAIKNDDCCFQVEFQITSEKGFQPLPDSQRVNIDDEDYLSNQLLYRNIKNYAIGHGCATEWDEENGVVKKISTVIFPEYEIKPIIPSTIPGVSLEMYKMSDMGDFTATIQELKTLCERYRSWIDGLKVQVASLEPKYTRTANKQILKCESCLERLIVGVNLLEKDATVRKAFQYMNRAMLLQQLHYNLPLQNWIDDGNDGIALENPVVQLPDITNSDTWYGDRSRYGKWRPFQLAFIIINLQSMANKKCVDRKKVDLIWFPTGGGKTEAYLGLSAYTIFIRRLRNKDDAGTAILMRYTLRLLTAQQYERASAMICACDLIRLEHQDELGTFRISIGLWVGGDTTPNSMHDAVKAYDKLYNGSSDINPFVLLKCPWCGAQMGVITKKNNHREMAGYKKIGGAKRSIVFQCRNHEYKCNFAKDDFGLPLFIADDVIYENTPTLLLGTVDKFAMLPFRPQAQRLFGIYDGEKKTSPDLIIQDELHLISGPLGSMVGHYETMINDLCTERNGAEELKPKIIASTATISRAKEQCHDLYGCGRDNVVQFPPSGLDAGNSFFAEEASSLNGRKYVGILAAGSSSDSTTMIRLYASILYAAKAIAVASEELRDPYWTNIGYFNSIRELGQMATWVRADIDEYLHVIYKRRYEDKKEGYTGRRYIWRDEELTSRIRSDKIPFSLQNLGIKYPSAAGERKPVDICLATNMISVGVDVPRLGLMTVAGQPKTTSEYIQATSRVGRDSSSPGLVFTMYRPGRPRDKSHYEHFKSYHSRVYCNVEPTSVTPFSAPLRERALHAIIIGIFRLKGNKAVSDDPPIPPTDDEVRKIKAIICSRVDEIDKGEIEATIRHIDEIIEKWRVELPQKYQDFKAGSILPLMFPAGTMRNEAWGSGRGIPTQTSMRSVDSSCEAYVLENRYVPEAD
ncbi:MAG: helicase-related protein [Negativicutes bacterium]